MLRKLRIISTFMTSKSGKQVITIHILPNISRSKGNQAMRVDSLFFLFSIHYLTSIDIYIFLIILVDNILIKIDGITA